MGMSNCAVLFGFYSTEHLTTSNYTVIGVGGGGSYPGSARTSAGTSLASSRESSCASCPGITQPFRIAMVGAAGVGKTSLVCQFMTSESLHIYDASIGEYTAGQTSSTMCCTRFPSFSAFTTVLVGLPLANFRVFRSSA